MNTYQKGMDGFIEVMIEVPIGEKYPLRKALHSKLEKLFPEMMTFMSHASVEDSRYYLWVFEDDIASLCQMLKINEEDADVFLNFNDMDLQISVGTQTKSDISWFFPEFIEVSIVNWYSGNKKPTSVGIQYTIPLVAEKGESSKDLKEPINLANAKFKSGSAYFYIRSAIPLDSDSNTIKRWIITEALIDICDLGRSVYPIHAEIVESGTTFKYQLFDYIENVVPEKLGNICHIHLHAIKAFEKSVSCIKNMGKEPEKPNFYITSLDPLALSEISEVKSYDIDNSEVVDLLQNLPETKRNVIWELGIRNLFVAAEFAFFVLTNPEEKDYLSELISIPSIFDIGKYVEK